MDETRSDRGTVISHSCGDIEQYYHTQMTAHENERRRGHPARRFADQLGPGGSGIGNIQQGYTDGQTQETRPA